MDARLPGHGKPPQGARGVLDGPVWAAHKAAANNMMLDSNDVLLLKPARPDTAFRVSAGNIEIPDDKPGSATVLAGIYQMAEPVDAALVSRFEERMARYYGRMVSISRASS